MNEQALASFLPPLFRPVSTTHKRTRNSCLKCRQRKIRCTRERPQCYNCLRFNHLCQYEAPLPLLVQPSAQAPQSAFLSTSIDNARDERMGDDAATERESIRKRLLELEHTVARLVSAMPADSDSSRKTPGDSSENVLDDSDVASSAAHISVQLGKLLTDVTGEPRYHTTSHWGQMIQEDISLASSADGDRASSLPLLLFSPVSVSFDAADYLPSAPEARWLCDVFQSRVHPVVRIMHRPTFEEDLGNYFQSMEKNESPLSSQLDEGSRRIKAGFEALLFAVFYCAVFSLTDAEFGNSVHSVLGGHDQNATKDGFGNSAPGSPSSNKGRNRLACLESYRYACCQCLLQSEIFERQSLPSVSALFLLLFAAYHEAGVPSIYTLVGVLIRIARSLGLHIDPEILVSESRQGGRFGGATRSMTPTLMETRRRLWHQVLHLDLMVCEARGIDPEMISMSDLWPNGMGCSFPGNFDDDEISADPSGDLLSAIPLDRRRHTEMSLQLVRLNVSFCFRELISFSRLKPPGKNQQREKDLEHAIREMVSKNQRCHLQYCSDTEPVPYMILLLGKMAEYRAWLYYYLFVEGPLSSTTSGDRWSPSRQRALVHATELQKLYNAAMADPIAVPFLWHIRRHNQFHATLHILNELSSHRPDMLDEKTREICQCAWAAVDGIQFRAPGQTEKDQQPGGRVFDALEQMRDAAQRHWSADEANSNTFDPCQFAGFDMPNPWTTWPTEAMWDVQTWSGDFGFGRF
ncbi:Fungal Zn binuclear cluster domain containing protein [Niveomyces insectorum RCEF 264]|uniref:Fungal Zn binuclear cluster domain containing protein n=1 Tax=Niveomyces insectorum RCEF 264 TaxID=1081102 RepID=A0A167T8Y6_9HYPO|nr:Fungal Zn binuclear cluster domain containing protein [Niveomyces insectorum RCEF 264]